MPKVSFFAKAKAVRVAQQHISKGFENTALCSCLHDRYILSMEREDLYKEVFVGVGISYKDQKPFYVKATKDMNDVVDIYVSGEAISSGKHFNMTTDELGKKTLSDLGVRLATISSVNRSVQEYAIGE